MYGTAYHATCRRFKSFDSSFFLGNTYCGKGVYLTSNIYDCVENYNRKGCDRNNQVYHLMKTTNCTTMQARNRLGLNHGRSFLLTCKFTLKNPFIIDKHENHYSEFNLNETARFCSKYCDDRKTKLFMKLVKSEFSNHQMLYHYKDFCYNTYDYIYNMMEDFNLFLRWFGYDGYTQNANSYFPPLVDRFGEVTHYVVFNSKNVIITESETF